MSDSKYKDIGSPETKLIEECSELIHIICKGQRFGWDNWHPDDVNKTHNTELLKLEIADVKEAIMNLEIKLFEGE